MYTPDEGDFNDGAAPAERFAVELVPAHGQTCLVEMAGCEYEVDVEISETDSSNSAATFFDRCLEGGQRRCDSGTCTVKVSGNFELEIPHASRANLTVRNRGVIPALTSSSQPVYYDVLERQIIIEAR